MNGARKGKDKRAASLKITNAVWFRGKMRFKRADYLTFSDEAGGVQR